MSGIRAPACGPVSWLPYRVPAPVACAQALAAAAINPYTLEAGLFRDAYMAAVRAGKSAEECARLARVQLGRSDPLAAEALERERIWLRSRMCGENDADRRLSFRLLIVESSLALLRGYVPPAGAAPGDTIASEAAMQAAAEWLWNNENPAG